MFNNLVVNLFVVIHFVENRALIAVPSGPLPGACRTHSDRRAGGPMRQGPNFRKHRTCSNATCLSRILAWRRETEVRRREVLGGLTARDRKLGLQ